MPYFKRAQQLGGSVASFACDRGLAYDLMGQQAQAQAQDSGEESDRARAQIEALDRDYRAFLVRVRKESLEQASLMAVEPVTLSEIQALLPEGTTLLVADYTHAGAIGFPVGVPSPVVNKTTWAPAPTCAVTHSTSFPGVHCKCNPGSVEYSG